MNNSSSPSSQEEQTMLQAYGQTQYRAKDYEGALDAFTKALRLGKGDQIGILDNRAASYCAIQSLDFALQDGRRMIKTDKTDPRGYLRTANILQLQKRLKDALKLYKYALNVANKNDPKYKQIEMLQVKLEKALTPPKRQDPFAVLPPELAALILGFLDLKSMLKTIQVSKRWESLASSVRTAWTHLDLSKARKSVPLHSVRAFLRRSPATLRRATLDWLTPARASTVISLLAQCPNLSHLDVYLRPGLGANFLPLHTLTNLTTLITDPVFEMTSDQLYVILKSCPLLEQVDVSLAKSNGPVGTFPHVPQLRCFTIRQLYNPLLISFMNDDNTNKPIPNLEELRIFNTGELRREPLEIKFSTHHNLRKVVLDGLCILPSPEFPKSLESLSLKYDLFHSMSQRNPLTGLSNLKSASFVNVRTSYAILNQYFVENQPTLSFLAIRWCPDISGTDLIRLMMDGHFKSITTLQLGGVFGVTDSVIEVMVETMPNLVELDLTRTEVTGLAVKYLADAEGSKLKHLTLHDLAFVMSRDAIEYGRSKGITIPQPLTPD